jgi:exodeoxyribonuclease VII large subunit
MTASDEIPTLAELRGARGRRARQPAAGSSAPTLFDAPMDTAPAPPTKEARARKAAAGVAETAVAEETKVSSVSEPRVWSVGELVRQVRGLVERSYGQISVKGEISNWRPATSGHCYFTLKDRDAQLSIVIFRRQASLLRFQPKDGDAVRLRGQLSVYESRGQMQLVAEWMEQVGLGAMLAAVRALKERLRHEGLFDRKRPLPEFPRCIGIVTSLQGAALRDIVKVCRRRHAAVKLLIYPAAVQGARCATEVAAGVRWFSAHPKQADVVIVARGGGSWEDLHGFDDEDVARAIAACAVPVISGIGHATDTTIADAAADVCAPTPSAAAELVTAAQHQVEARVDRLHSRLGCTR